MSVKLIAFLSVVLIGLGVTTYFLFKKNRELSTSLKNTTSLYEDASLQLGRARIELGDANKKVSELSDGLQAELKARKEVAKTYTEIQAKYTVVNNQTNIPLDNFPAVTDGQLVNDNFKEGHYYLAQDPISKLMMDLGPELAFSMSDQRLTINNKVSTIVDRETKLLVPAADVKYQLRLSLIGRMVNTIDPSGNEHAYVELSEVDPRTGKETGRFELTKFSVTTNDQRAKKISWWNPHLDAGIIAGYNGDIQLGGSIGVSLISYGLTKNDMSWRFIRPGVTLSNKKVGLDIAPVLYNIGDPLPLVSNLWIGPYIGTDFSKLGTGLMLNLVL